jgi:3-oxoacyl-[acyl-carrier protein] reductase
MADRYAQLVNAPLLEKVADLVGLPKPTPLRRYEPGQPLTEGPALVGGSGRMADHAVALLEGAGVEVHREPDNSDTAPRYGALVFDATGIDTTDGLIAMFAFFNTTVRRLGRCGRMVVIGTPPALTGGPAERTAQRTLEGFVRSAGKEMRAGSTANLLLVAPDAEDGAVSPLRFLLSARSAFVCGQVITVGAPTDHAPTAPASLDTPLEGKVAVVTGAARGIGEAIARTLARDGAHVVCLDLPAQGQLLSRVANSLADTAGSGEAFQMDITAPDAPERLAAHLTDRHGGVDIVVHNAGVTRDKTLAGMDDARWNMVMAINLQSMERIDDHLLNAGTLNEGGRIVCVSSMSGIAGNRGQTNYAASKAGVIGHVEALADTVAATGSTINAVAPGFIETEMTDAMPLGPREVGRRISSLGQGGQPEDVAETIAFFASPDATWVNGTTLRVCGQNLLGA